MNTVPSAKINFSQAKTRPKPQAIAENDIFLFEEENTVASEMLESQDEIHLGHYIMSVKSTPCFGKPI